MAGVKVTEDKKITIKPIIRTKGRMPKGHDGEFMFTGCNRDITLPYEINTGSLVNIFKDSSEREAFEKALNLKEGTLTIHDRKNPYWAKFIIRLTKEELTLDLNNVKHVLQYRILKANKDKIAPTWAARKQRPSYRWAIIEPNETIEEGTKKAKAMLTATDLYGEIKNSNKKMVDVLRLLKKKPAKNATKDWLQGEIGKIMAQTEKSKGLLDIHDFIKVASDKNASDKIFVMDAVEAGAIRQSEGVFRDAETDAPLGRSLQSVVDYFASSEHQEDKILIQEKIKRADR